MNPFGVVTGCDDGHMVYADVMLKSLTTYNDLQAPIFFLDFGLSIHNREYLASRYAIAEFYGFETVRPALDALESVPGAKARPNFAYVYKTMKKLALATVRPLPSMLWIDADCLVLAPLSAMPLPAVSGFHAARTGRVRIAKHFCERHDLVNEALAAHFCRRYGIVDESTDNGFNSGVLLYNSDKYAELMAKYAADLLGAYGPYVLGDQALLALAMTIEGLKIQPLDWRFNVSWAQGMDGFQLKSEHVGGKQIANVRMNGEKVFVLHFLNYKPHLNLVLDHAVQKLFDAWRAA